MNWILPGTVLEMDRGEADQAEAKISSLFLAGGVVLSQVTDLTGLEPYTVQNWVKRGFLPPPVRKRYSRRQLCRIININMLKSLVDSCPEESVELYYGDEDCFKFTAGKVTQVMALMVDEETANG